MAIASKRLKAVGLLTNAPVVMVQNPASPTKTDVQGIFLHNTHSAAVKISIWNVPQSGGGLGTPVAGNRFYYFDLDPEDTIAIDLGKPGWVLEDEFDAVFAQADVTSVVTVTISGFLET